MSYDANGNITALTRRGRTSSGYGLMDNLTIAYTGNRPTGVSESVSDNNLSGSFEYKKSRGSGYMFNDNGSLVADKCRGIAYITYDFNNNPRQIYFTNGSVTKYVYSASGRKLRVVHYTAVPNITRTWGVKPPELTLAQILLSDSVDYLLGGSMVMKNGRVDKYLFEGGYAQASVAGSTTDSFAFFYYNKDHLGSIREVVDANGNIRQVTNYYPFGAPYADSPVNPDHQPYKYNGKELDRMHGLDTYDYGARQHDPILARWDRMDPLCEKYYGTSPYVYCGDNPVKYIDEHGDSLSLSGSEDDVNLTLRVYNQGLGGYYHVSVDKKGNVFLNANRNIDSSKMTIQEKTVYEQLSRAINSNYMTTINVQNNSSEVIIGNATTATVDIGDIISLNGLTNSDPVAALMHETNEQYFLQNPNFHPTDKHRIVIAHAAAEGLEHSYTGNIGVTNVLNVNNNSGYLEFHKDNCVIERKKINNGNF